MDPGSRAQGGGQSITSLSGPTFAIDTRDKVIAGNRAMEKMTGHACR
jgi:hypothetical protein